MRSIRGEKRISNSSTGKSLRREKSQRDSTEKVNGFLRLLGSTVVLASLKFSFAYCRQSSIRIRIRSNISQIVRMSSGDAKGAFLRFVVKN